MKISIAFQILKLIYVHSVITAEAISVEVNLSVRSVYRYIDELCLCGIPIQTITGRQGGIYIPTEHKMATHSLWIKELELYVH